MEDISLAQAAVVYLNDGGRAALLARYRQIRQQSEQLCQPLAIEDYVIQSITETSPPKWHLAHTSWFFETLLLKVYLPDYHELNPHYAHLFNSYYDTLGEQFSRSQRGLLSRPTIEEIYAYRNYVDAAMVQLLEGVDEQHWQELSARVILGLNHEQQHQELLLTDIKHNFSVNPMRPVYQQAKEGKNKLAPELKWFDCQEGLADVGHEGQDFAYDNETPRHQVLLEGCKLASRLVTNGEFLAFMDDGGYQRPELWLSDGWAMVCNKAWQAPLYWEQVDGHWWHMTLGGMHAVNLEAPVCHVSFYEAEAYARWAGKRLPLESEWEVVTGRSHVQGNLRNAGYLQPVVTDGDKSIPQQLFGDVWEWTQSPYVAYPGYRRVKGPLGEYNGKFMCNQIVLRGGSCVTPDDHIRASYRNFFYPGDRWQFSGIRLGDSL
ncbi:MAG: ergothioneine biosynthesis protein EgtB [Gammaproteobacteria bacterium]|nr:ergothioneine biosynthesis protein EgtB [Gammaproteobacteria bacterium]